jgi:hypothetical protein
MDAALSERSLTGRVSPIVVFILLAVTLVLAPLFRSGQPPLALLVLQLLSVALIVTVLWRPPAGFLSRREVFGLLLLLLLPLLYLVPIPAMVAGWLPGRDVYLAGFALLDAEVDVLRPSIYPFGTESAFLTLLLPVAVFLGARSLDSHRVMKLVTWVFAIAILQVLLGLMQFGSGKDSGLYLGMEFTNFGSAVGTYTNRNHLVGLIEMLLPVALALFLYSLGRRGRDRAGGWRRRVSFFGSLRGHVAIGYGALALLLLIGVIFTRSRAGTALTMLGVLLVTIAFSRRIGGDNVYGPAGTIVAVAVGLGIVIGLAPILDRFAQMDPMEDSRWVLFSATIDGIGAFFPLGSGPGTYAAVFPAFQSLELGRWFVNYAHNDYLQWLFEGGLLVGLVILVLLGLYFFQWGKVWTGDAWSRFRFVQVGAGIGILLLLLHELVDYNLHMPANMVFFAFLAGIFFSDPDREPATAGRRRRRRTPDLAARAPEVAPAPVRPASPAADQIPNPFLD